METLNSKVNATGCVRAVDALRGLIAAIESGRVCLKDSIALKEAKAALSKVNFDVR